MNRPLNAQRRALFVRLGEDHVFNAEEIALVANKSKDKTSITLREGHRDITVDMPFKDVMKILNDWEFLR